MKTGNTTDALLERALGGEDMAFLELFDHFGARLRHYVSDRMGPRLASQLEADDLVQEVFGEVFPRIQRFGPRGKGTFYKLLVTIANRRWINLERNLAVMPPRSSGRSHTGIRPASHASIPQRAAGRASGPT